MKKLLALVLSVIMAASLAAPAFASPGLSPEEAAALEAIGGAAGPTAIITSGPIDLGNINWEDYGLEGMSPDSITWEELAKELEQQAQAQRDELKKSLGGVPGQVGVRVNNEYIQFPGAAPEIVDGTTMVPVRALMEALGGEVEFADGRVVCKTDEIRLTFTLGSNEALVEYPGGELMSDGQIFPLGRAPYLKGSRAYVPLRFLAEALGYEVGWDSGFETAILLDREAMAAEIDKDFTILNRALANRTAGWEKGKSLSTDVKGNITVTAFDTLNGNKTYQGSVSSQTLMNAGAASGSASIKLSNSAVDELIENLISSNAPEEDIAAVRERMELVLDALEDMEFIMTREGQMWVHAPVLDELGGEKDIWCGMEMSAEEIQTVFVDSDTATVGTVLAGLVPTDSVVWPSESAPVSALAELCMDQNFTTSGGVSTLTISAEELGELYSLYAGVGMSGIEDEFEEFSFTVKVDSKGGTTVDCVMETAARYGTPAVRVAISSAQSGETASLTMEYHIANWGEAKLTFTVRRRAVSGEPVSEPPAGANVVDAPELLNP